MDVETLVQLGDAQGVKLEIVGGVGIWEALPTKRHLRTACRMWSWSIRDPGWSPTIALMEWRHI